MKLIDKYIAKTVLSSIILVTLTLVGLNAFILFIDQLGDLGRGHYGALQAGLVVLLGLPYQIYLFFPVACLLGTLIGLGLLANHRELIVMRAAGMSIGNITWAVFKMAIILILMVTLMGEWGVPYFSKWSRDVKMQAITGGKIARTSAGVWLRYKQDFLRLGQIISGNTLENIVQFHFNSQYRLVFSRTIQRAYLDKGQWFAENIRETHFKKNHTTVLQEKSKPWKVQLNPLILTMTQNEPDEMSLLKLHRYLTLTEHSKNVTARFKLAYWQRIIQPFTTLVMMALAIPFIFGPLRSSTMGAKLLIGMSVGFGFHLINRFFGPVTQVLQWPPEIAAIAPSLVFAILGFYLMRKAYL